VVAASGSGVRRGGAGLGELWLDTLEEANAALASPEWRDVIADAATFMDFDRVDAAWATAGEAPASPRA
jgi:EthD domain-containing protein